MNNILFFPTMRCNLKCEYCHFTVKRVEEGYHWSGYGKSHYIQEEMDWQDYLIGFDRLAPYHLEISGGEPTLYEGLRELIDHIPASCTWAITSNTLGNYKDYDFSKCIAWTASCHVDNQTFRDNCHFLNQKAPFSVSFVAEKTNLSKSIYKAIKYASWGYKINILRELNPGVDWRGSAEWETLEHMRHLGFNVVEDDIPASYDFNSGYLCNGGFNYFAMMPDGSIYRCYSEAMQGKAIGNIIDLTKYIRPQECYQECLGCAMDYKARIQKLEKNIV